MKTIVNIAVVMATLWFSGAYAETQQPNNVSASQKIERYCFNNNCKSLAAMLLERLRVGTLGADISINSLRRILKESGLTLEDIGTSEDEIKQLYVKGLKLEAASWLKHLRTATGDSRNDILFYMRETLKGGGLTLEDIGTSEDEIAKLMLKSC